MRALVGKLARKLAPGTMESLAYVREVRQRAALLDPADVAQLHAELIAVRERVERLEETVARLEDLELSVNEHRRDVLRVAELTDLVLTRLRAVEGASGTVDRATNKH
ncbi:MAG: hypothetical protein EAS51_07450 [Microbacteriaceae bacterium]|nr:MAG: hypothetical protein EAS51_07450 [Microbacteriaceae bacterium]